MVTDKTKKKSKSPSKVITKTKKKSKLPSKVLSKTKNTNLSNQHKVIIYGALWCPFCVQAKEYSKKKLKSEAIFIEVDATSLKSIEHNLKLKKKLNKSVSLNSIPVIFVNDKYVGGFDDLKNKY